MNKYRLPEDRIKEICNDHNIEALHYLLDTQIQHLLDQVKTPEGLKDELKKLDTDYHNWQMAFMAGEAETEPTYDGRIDEEVNLFKRYAAPLIEEARKDIYLDIQTDLMSIGCKDSYESMSKRTHQALIKVRDIILALTDKGGKGNGSYMP